jgi:hypothetical protein
VSNKRFIRLAITNDNVTSATTNNVKIMTRRFSQRR